MTDRRSLSINYNDDVKAMMDAIVQYIIRITPVDPIYPAPLQPVRVDSSDEYNPVQLCGACARLLAEHIAQGRVSQETLERLHAQTEVLREYGIKALTGQVQPRYIADLTAIAQHLALVLGVKMTNSKGDLNLKMPLMVALLYAYEYVESK